MATGILSIAARTHHYFRISETLGVMASLGLPILVVLMAVTAAIKRRIVDACAACILANQQVTVREAELLRAICDTLDCPLPPLVVGEAEGR